MVFGAGQYSPETSKGKQLMAHELSHVVQQGQNNQSVEFNIEVGHSCM